MAYGNSVFINCPFDNDFYPLLKAIIFTVIYCKLVPIISETKGSDDIRIHEIKNLIRNSKYSIHDISRIEPLKKGDLPRFNMPFELGLDLGCKEFSLEDKKCLILEREKYRYQKILSDISGQDIRNHDNQPIEIIHQIRDWFQIIFPRRKIDNYALIWDYFNEFTFDFNKSMKKEKMDPDKIGEIPFSQIIKIIKGWINNKRP